MRDVRDDEEAAEEIKKEESKSIEDTKQKESESDYEFAWRKYCEKIQDNHK